MITRRPPPSLAIFVRPPVGLRLAAAALLLGGPLAAQADSLAGAARNAYREAVAAERRGDLAAALGRAAAAAEAWPVQPFYLEAAAGYAARAGDTTAVTKYLGRLAALGAGPVLPDAPFAALAAVPSVAAALRQVAANRVPLANSVAVATLPDTAFYPEGADVDSATGDWFVASVRQRRLVRIDPAGRATDFGRLPAGRRLDAALGVRVDVARRVVWLTTRVLPQMEDYRKDEPTRATVWAFSLPDGRLLGAATAEGTNHWFGDLVVAPDGSVILSDSESPVLYRARLGAGGVELVEVLRHRLFRSLQGLVFDEAGRRLYLADYSHGLLLADLAAGTVVPVSAPAGVTTLGIDGIARSGRSIVAVQNGIAPARVVRFDLAAPGRIAAAVVIDRHLPLADEPTIGAVVGDRFVYVANSQWEKYAEDGSRRPGTVLAQPVLLSVPIGRP